MSAAPSVEAMPSRASVAHICTASDEGVGPAGKGAIVVEVVVWDALDVPLEQLVLRMVRATTAVITRSGCTPES